MKENKMLWQRKTCGKRLDSAKRIQICATWSFFKMALEIRNFKIQFKTYILAILQIFIMIQLLLKKFVWCVTLVRQFFVRIVHLDVLVSVCLFVSNKRQNGRTDRAQIFCGTSRDSREGLWIIKISNICLHQNLIVIKFFKILKIREIFCKNPRIIFV